MAFRPLLDAITALTDLTPVASALRSRDWQTYVPAELRNQAQFSSGVESIRVLDLVQDKLTKAVSGLTEEVKNGRAIVSRESFVADLKKLLAEEGLGTGDGGLTDISSARRLRLIYDTQMDRAHAFARHKAGQDPDLLAAFPAQELIRLESRKAPRDWTARWQAAGGQIYQGRMIALKSSPVWAAISRFGTAFPPFDFGSGMGVEDVSREEAVELGVIAPGEHVSPAPDTGLGQPSADDLGPQKIAQLRLLFVDQLVTEPGGRVRFQSREERQAA
jgi:hypothetical protein